MRTTVIAEPGSTHEGDLDTMLRLVELSAEIGCDVFKNQWVSSPDELCTRRRAPDYRDAYRKISYPWAWHEMVAAHCKALGLEYACSVYLPADASAVAPYCEFLKCASFEHGAEDLMEAFARTGLPVVVSCGMGGLPAQPGGMPISWLHCVSAYPAPIEQMNLAVLHHIDPGDNDNLDNYAGLSDHSKHPWTGALAVAAGASIVEFHLRLDDADPANADYAVARAPEEAREYVANIRTAELMLGDGHRRVQPSEQAMLKYLVRP